MQHINMTNKDSDTEQIILNAAEAEFLEKGFGNAKMMAIAKRAGVSHSMLHYYFRSKENMFQMIFQQKIRMLSQFFGDASGLELSFPETIRLIVERQFNLIAQNQCMPSFILHEIISSKDHLNMVLEVILPGIAEIFRNIEKMLNKEIEKGTIRPISICDLIVNIISLNVSSFLYLTLLEQVFPETDEKVKETYLNERCESNVQFILNALRP
jgi:AcrR family transcriptional regulator